MKNSAIVKGMKVTAREWEGYGKKKIYFKIHREGAGSSAKLNQVEWDVQKGDFNYRTRDSFLASPHLSNTEAQEWEVALKEAFGL